MAFAIDVNNEDLDEVLDILADMGYEENVWEYWQENAYYSTIRFYKLGERQIEYIIDRLLNKYFIGVKPTFMPPY